MRVARVVVVPEAEAVMAVEPPDLGVGPGVRSAHVNGVAHGGAFNSIRGCRIPCHEPRSLRLPSVGDYPLGPWKRTTSRSRMRRPTAHRPSRPATPSKR